jgi:hypothetical protein
MDLFSCGFILKKLKVIYSFFFRNRNQALYKGRAFRETFSEKIFVLNFYIHFAIIIYVTLVSIRNMKVKIDY